MKYSFLLFFSLIISGCTSKTSIFVYNKHLSEEKTTAIKNILEDHEYKVSIVEFDFPPEIQKSTLLYSLLLNDKRNVDSVISLLNSLNLNIQNVDFMQVGNHWYTGNSLALFILPENDKDKFKKKYALTYTSDECEQDVTLTLDKSGTYEIIAPNISKELDAEKLGTWHIRQHPILELRPSDSAFATHFFEIAEYKDRDAISEIDVISLSVLNSALLSEQCTIKYGIRIN